MRKCAALFLALLSVMLTGCGFGVDDYRVDTVIFIPADSTTGETEQKVLPTSYTLDTEPSETETSRETAPETTKATTPKKTSGSSSSSNKKTEPTTKPTTAPTTSPTTEPTTKPTTEPTTKPTTVPTTVPTTEPTTVPTMAPTTAPTTKPTTEPTSKPTTEPTTKPTTVPTMAPTTASTTKPTTAPTIKPTTVPTTAPTTAPTTVPTTAPTTVPTTAPTEPVTVPSEAPTETQPTGYDISGYTLGALEMAMMDEINRYRAAEGLSELGKNSRLCAIASVRAYEASLSWSHSRPDGTSYTTVFDEYGFGCGASAENLLYTSGGEDAATLVARWMNNEGNRDILMNSGFYTIGIGAFYANGFTYLACLVVA